MARPAWVLLALAALTFGCAQHTVRMAEVQALMTREKYPEALEAVGKVCKSQDNVLCLLERGLLLHYAGSYDESNQVLERAEVLTEDLYTKSLSREAASLVTSDLALEYVPKPFEQMLVNYFRALNYMLLGKQEDALVECRKMGDKLARFSDDEKRPYRNDAFLQYLTGMLYEWGGETNNAFISYSNARDAYVTYAASFGMGPPPELTCDILRTAGEMDFADEIARITAEDRQRCDTERPRVGSAATGVPAETHYEPGSRPTKIVVFVEQGFAPAMEEISLNVPILKSETKHAEDNPYDFSVGISSRFYGNAFDAGDIAYFLRIAIPRYPDRPATMPPPALFLDALALPSAECEDVSAIARTELDHDMPGIFVKTLARAIIKYKASTAAGNKWGDIVGKLVNIATAATERADLRAWLSLPRTFYVATSYVEPGAHTVMLQPGAPSSVDVEGTAAHLVLIGDASGARGVRFDAGPGTTTFIRFRQY
jgi:uncharacterized protein